ncbi:hypothetical protein OGATHE_006724 [Ogataea polymorpha]|uniref:Uncharacterized protein n=1 Tax=Ogataea polymorpha TaxID=460523 RepID=A0A9P8SXD7_9ASCO|nr:hypothetical protein OGATHE_006724 [Ogataea polymorpha]
MSDDTFLTPSLALDLFAEEPPRMLFLAPSPVFWTTLGLEPSNVVAGLSTADLFDGVIGLDPSGEGVEDGFSHLLKKLLESESALSSASTSVAPSSHSSTLGWFLASSSAFFSNFSL